MRINFPYIIRQFAFGALVLTCSCAKESIIAGGSKGSGLIAFEVATGSVETRTSYARYWTSGSAASENEQEYIDWVAGDVIRIYSKEADGSFDGIAPVTADNNNKYCADYKVSASTDAATTHQAPRVAIEPYTLDPYGTGSSEYGGLQWGTANKEHHLYAVYPSPSHINSKDRGGNAVKDPSDNDMSSMDLSAGWHTAATAAATADRIGVSAASIEGAFYVAGSLPAVQQGYWSKFDAGATSEREFRPNMNYATMVAYNKSIPKTDGSKIVLGFEPVFTALEFRLLSIAGDPIDSDLISAELSSATTDLCGSFVTTFVDPAKVTGGRNNRVSDKENGPDNNRAAIYRTVCEGAASGGKKVTLHFGTGKRLMADNPLTFTFLVLPQAFDKTARTPWTYTETEVTTRLTLKLTFANGLHRSLELRYDFDKDGEVSENEWVSIQMYKKAYFKNMQVPNDRSWVFDVDWWPQVTPSTTSMEWNEGGGTDPNCVTVASYRTVNGTSTAVGYKIQSREWDEDSQSWSAWADKVPSWLEMTVPLSNFAGSTSKDKMGLTMKPQLNSATDPHAQELMKEGRKKGSVAAPFDLSTLDVATGSTVATSTANCYVVQGYGHYKFPLVYGNALRGGEANTTAYQSGVSDNTRFYHKYVDHLGNGIDSPYVATQLSGSLGTGISPVLIWESEPGLVVNLRLLGTTPQDYAIGFEVPRETICQGNALLGVLVNGVIAWSWHIWITDEDLAVSDKSQQAGSNGYRFMPKYIGWCEGVQKHYAGRKAQLRFVQSISGLISEEMTINQKENDYKTRGHGAFYQWGRKDPFAPYNGQEPANTDGKARLYYVNADYTVQRATYGVTTGTSIQKPYVFYVSDEEGQGQGNWCLDAYNNSWNSRLTPADFTIINGDQNYDKAALVPVRKTIYDPSPVGFNVPSTAAWNGFATSDVSVVGTMGQDGYGIRYSGGGSNVFFPATGFLLRGLSEAVNGFNVHTLNEINTWSSIPGGSSSSSGDEFALCLLFLQNYVPLRLESRNPRANGFPVLPVWHSPDEGFSVETAGQHLVFWESDAWE